MSEHAPPRAPAPAHRPRQLLLLGCGALHLELLALLGGRPLPGVQTTLVVPQAQTMSASMLAGFVAGHYSLDDCRVALAPLLQDSGIRWQQAGVHHLDLQQRCVGLTDGQTLAFDWLSIDTGCVQEREVVERALPGARANALFLHPLEGFAALWPQVLALGRTRALRLAVVGAEAPGCELALALRQCLPDAAITLLCGTVLPLPDYPASAQRRMRAALAAARITVLHDVATALSDSALTLGCGAQLACDVALLTQGAPLPRWLQASGLALDAQGAVTVDSVLRSSSHPEVFAAGAVRGHAAALRLAAVLAHNLGASIRGLPLQAAPRPARALDLRACGNGTALASWDRFSLQGRWLWRLKDRLDRRMVARYRRP